MRNSNLKFILGLSFLLSGAFDISGNNTLKSGSGSDYAGNYDVSFYFLDLNISDSSTYVRGHVAVHLFLLDNSNLQVTLDMADLLTADSVRVNGSPAVFNHAGNKLTVELPALPMPGVRVIVDIYYHGLGKNAENVTGIYNKLNLSFNKRLTWTLSESFSALNWFPCKQSLTDKADSVYVFLSTDNRLKAGSNGILTASVPLPGNRMRYEWKSRYPIDYYLISFALCDYIDYSFYVKPGNGSDSLLVQNYIYNDSAYLEQNRSNINKTGDLIKLYSDLFGPYPFLSEKYGHCVAPAGGGMEHQTMTTLVNFSFLLVAHELFHQWFGDYVTCKTWQDIWINEGFASYAEYLANQYLVSQSSADGWMVRTQEFVKSLPGGSVYVPEPFMEDESRIFDGRLTYSKGAAIIHMIRQEVGNDELFFSIMREFLRRYKNGNATGLDMRNLLAEMTGRNFDRFFEQWYFGEGFPSLSINWTHKNDTLYVSSLQSTSSNTSPFSILLEYQVKINGHDSIISHRQDSSLDNWQVYLPGEITGMIVDPRHWLLMNISGISRIESLEKSQRYELMPNPAHDKVTLRFTEPVDNYTVLVADANGKILYTEQSKSLRKTIDIGKFPSGMYFVIVNEKNIVYQSRFIKD